MDMTMAFMSVAVGMSMGMRGAVFVRVVVAGMGVGAHSSILRQAWMLR
jgi:hypothetical protein